MITSREKLSRFNLLKVLLLGIILFIGFLTKAQTFTLEQCIDTALQYNRTIKLSQQDVFQANEKNKETKGNLFPKLNGITDYRYYTDLPYQLMPADAFGGPAGTYKEVQFGVPQSLNTNLQLTVPIYNPTALGAIKTTRIASELSEVQKRKTDEDVVLEVSNAYYNAQILLNQLAFLDSNMINTNKLLQTTTLLHQQQIAKGTDVDRLQLQLDQLANQRKTVFSQQQQVLNALKFLMGKPISDSIQVAITENTLVQLDPQIQATTDMKLIDKKLQFNYAELKGLRNSKLPSLGAYGVYGTTGYGNTGANSFFNFHPIGYVGAQLSIPLFNGTITKHKIVQKKIDIQKTNIQKELVSEKSKLDLINAEMQYTLANQNIATVNDQIKLAKKIYNNTVLQNKQGMATITDLLLADNSLREAQQNYIVAMVNLRKAELEYKRVTGNLMAIKN
ncbi:outer membrane efflux protein precursor [Aquipluma nitroreducens]|uniref:Outer membrane efflux protein n=2 Tax=Aquipluma nitroreducens TaxID=2010828 RepID=A0A5K7SF40_9BACT|nr:TolC family protein [Aquipluma nitroreducens]BBE20105.1 outer membrane efflux protein precursor [Aquipluma nitroreducens]